MKTNFYNFSQTNSGGELDVNDKLCHQIYIEANSPDEANEIAQTLGIYFNGVEEGLDCECCGDRWGCAHYGILNEDGEKRFGSYSKSEINKKISSGIVAKSEPSKNSYKPNRFDLVFSNIEDYVRFLSIEWPYDETPGNVESRIFYKSGKIVSFEGGTGRII